VEINLLGRDFDFEQLSRGEMNRVILSTSWAFRDVWESLNQTVNLMFIDEMIDNGLDQQGSESALDLMKRMARERNKNIFLISHKDDLVGRVNKLLLVKKENSFTRFDMDADDVE
jgi:DNA repair exonuclease SbcCD ATPase subunit